MKKILCIIVLLLVAWHSALAYDLMADGIYYNMNSDGTSVAVTGNSNSDTGYSGAVTIPSTVTCSGKTYTVTAIGESAFEYCTGLTAITIPNTVTLIGSTAFSGCKGLTAITIPGSVTAIGEFAFFGCSGFASIVVDGSNAKYDSRDSCNAIIETGSNTLILGCKNTIIPNTVTAIGEDAFNQCTGLTAIAIPKSVVSIGGFAFYLCTGLTAVTIPNSVRIIGKDAFYGCENLTALSIPGSVKTIGSQAFAGCIGLTSIIVDGNNTKYDSRDNCNAIIETGSNTLIVGCKNTIIPGSITKIGDYAFHYIPTLTSVTIPCTVTAIGDEAFRGCTALTAITIPGSVTSIGSWAFNGCAKLTEVTIPESVSKIGVAAFALCSKLKTVTYNAKNCTGPTIDLNAWFRSCPLTKLVIGDSVQTIPAYLACKQTRLTSVTIPGSVSSICANAFTGCTGVKNVYVAHHNPITLTTDVFDAQTYASAILHCPPGRAENYKAQNYWEKFVIINDDYIPVPGDVNGDGKVDVTDLSLIVDMILGLIDKNAAGDINGDGAVDVGDVSALIDIILQ